MRDKLTSISKMGEKWFSIKPSTRRNLILRTCGLESTFTPTYVLESVREDGKGGFESVCSDRNGRILWVGPTKNSTRVERWKFTCFRDHANFNRRKSDRFSYLVDTLEKRGLSAEAVRPLWRLSLVFFTLKWKAFVRLVRAVIARLDPNTKVRMVPRVNPLRFKPHLSRDVAKEHVVFLNNKTNLPKWELKPLRA
jgi:hypothetical protein